MYALTFSSASAKSCGCWVCLPSWKVARGTVSAKLGSCERFLEDCNEEGSQDHEDLVHTLHIQLQQHGGHCTIDPFRYVHRWKYTHCDTHQLMHTHSTTLPYTYAQTYKCTDSVSTTYQDILRCLMSDLAKFANFHFGKSFPLSGTRLFWTK